MRDIAMWCIAAALIVGSAHQAVGQVFEVIHPEVERGGFELEGLNGVVLDDLEPGEERSAHEIAIGYAPFSFWKTTIAVEIAKPEDENAEYEAFEWENVILAPIGEHAQGHGHDHGHDHDGFFSFGAAGLFVALEVPNEGGIDAGAIEVGPIAEMRFGLVETVANLFVEVPFEDEEDPGLSYALSAAVPVAEFEPVALAAGFEAHGGAEGVFGDALPVDDNSHVIGPAVYGDIDIGRGRVLEPRVALLFGLTDGSPDTVLSVNIELKF